MKEKQQKRRKTNSNYFTKAQERGSDEIQEHETVSKIEIRRKERDRMKARHYQLNVVFGRMLENK